MRGIYAIYDGKARDIIGMLTMQKHEAPALRAFVDAVTEPNSPLAKNPEDYTLVRLGFIIEDGNPDLHPAVSLTPDEAVIITAAQVLQTQAQMRGEA